MKIGKYTCLIFCVVIVVLSLGCNLDKMEDKLTGNSDVESEMVLEGKIAQLPLLPEDQLEIFWESLTYQSIGAGIKHYRFTVINSSQRYYNNAVLSFTSTVSGVTASNVYLGSISPGSRRTSSVTVRNVNSPGGWGYFRVYTRSNTADPFELKAISPSGYIGSLRINVIKTQSVSPPPPMPTPAVFGVRIDGPMTINEGDQNKYFTWKAATTNASSSVTYNWKLTANNCMGYEFLFFQGNTSSVTWRIPDYPGAKDWKITLVATNNGQSISKILKLYVNYYQPYNPCTGYNQ